MVGSVESMSKPDLVLESVILTLLPAPPTNSLAKGTIVSKLQIKLLLVLMDTIESLIFTSLCVTNCCIWGGKACQRILRIVDCGLPFRKFSDAVTARLWPNHKRTLMKPEAAMRSTWQPNEPSLTVV